MMRGSSVTQLQRVRFFDSDIDGLNWIAVDPKAGSSLRRL
jgi:hypothetical protein